MRNCFKMISNHNVYRPELFIFLKLLVLRNLFIILAQLRNGTAAGKVRLPYRYMCEAVLFYLCAANLNNYFNLALSAGFYIIATMSYRNWELARSFSLCTAISYRRLVCVACNFYTAIVYSLRFVYSFH